MNCRIGTDVTLEQIARRLRRRVPRAWVRSPGRPLPVEGADAPNCVTATAFLKAFNDGRMRYVGKRVVVVGGGDTSIDVATVARRLGHIEHVHESDRPEHVIAGHAAHDVASVSARQGAEVTLTSVFAIDKMQANRHEIEQALAEGIAIRGGWCRWRCCATRAAARPRCGSRAARPRWPAAGWRSSTIDGTEEDIEADLIVSAIGQAVDFTGLEA